VAQNKRAACPKCGERLVEEWQQVPMRYPVYVDVENGGLIADIDHPEQDVPVSEPSYRCAHCYSDYLSEEDILAAS
jgi:DNA-directed RNA polymerase subunit RPC12/RpoP